MNDSMIKTAKAAVVKFLNSAECDLSLADKVTEDDVLIVWFCKTIQNWKAIATTTLPFRDLYEITFNGDRSEVYVDFYQKIDKVTYKSKDLQV